jgi:hypothetical protein
MLRIPYPETYCMASSCLITARIKDFLIHGILTVNIEGSENVPDAHIACSQRLKREQKDRLYSGRKSSSCW